VAKNKTGCLFNADFWLLNSVPKCPQIAIYPTKSDQIKPLFLVRFSTFPVAAAYDRQALSKPYDPP